MPTTREHDARGDQLAQLLQQAIEGLGPELMANPNLAEILSRMVDEGMARAEAAQGDDSPVDGGLTNLLGLGPDAPADLGHAYASPGVEGYDDKIESERLVVAADLYYVYMHERIGIFRVLDKLKELFEAGSLRISGGPGAGALFRYHKHNILRYQAAQRWQAYKRVFGYTSASPGPNARANHEFHGLFVHFTSEAAKFWRDKRISEVIRDRATDPTFGSMAVVRRAALDLRNNLKNSSYGNINVLRLETGQMLGEAFKVLGAEDIRAQFGAANAWEVIELVLWQYFHEPVHASTLNRMAVSGRAILGWLARPFVLNSVRTTFEALLLQIAESAEEWISSEAGLRSSQPTPPARNVYVQGPPPRSIRPYPPLRSRDD